ncbi:MAG: 4Fe-4S dicluster domain-containing protein [Thermodesulfobacteriota bacterium]
MRRREFVKLLAGSLSATVLLPAAARALSLTRSPVTTNRLRPPGAVPEEIFAGKCIRCGRCVEVCPYRSIALLDIRAGVFAGTPIIAPEAIPCYLCMKCVEVCPTGTLLKVRQEETRMGIAVVNKHLCYTWQSLTICRTCFDVCPYKEKAITLDQLRPVVREDQCVGCGLCTHACPISAKDGKKAVNIEPIHAWERVQW